MKPTILPAGLETAALKAAAADLLEKFPEPEGIPDLDDLMPDLPETPDGAELAAEMMPDPVPPEMPDMGFEGAPIPETLPPLEMELPDEAVAEPAAGDTLEDLIPVLDPEEWPGTVPFDAPPGKPGLLADLFASEEEEDEGLIL